MDHADHSFHTLDIVLHLERSEDEAEWRKAAAEKLEVLPEEIADIRLRKHSIDARQKQIKIQLRL